MQSQIKIDSVTQSIEEQQQQYKAGIAIRGNSLLAINCNLQNRIDRQERGGVGSRGGALTAEPGGRFGSVTQKAEPSLA